jgi:hypothetical protein
MVVISGAKAPVRSERFAARLKSCPDTCDLPEVITAGVLPQRLKPALIEAETAGINACSTPWGKNSPGQKPPLLRRLYAALKGRSSTKQLYAGNSLRSSLPGDEGSGRSSTITGGR